MPWAERFGVALPQHSRNFGVSRPKDLRMDRCARIASLVAVCCFWQSPLMQLRRDAAALSIQVGRRYRNQRNPLTSTARSTKRRGAPRRKSASSCSASPTTGQAPTERTEVMLLRDENNLYVGVYAYDAEPDRVVGHADDARCVARGRRSHRDPARHVPRSAQRVLLRDESGGRAGRRPGVRERAAQHRLGRHLARAHDHARTTDGLRSSRFRSRASAFQPGRTCGDSTSRARSPASSKTIAGRARGSTRSSFKCPKPARSRISPGSRRASGSICARFSPAGWLHFGGGGQDDFTGKPGLDLFYSITPSLRLTATFNTDFGETEVDARQINLTRFSLLFPEKRAFFLEGAGVFSFASTGPETPGGIPGTGADRLSVLQPSDWLDRRPRSSARRRRQADRHRGANRNWRAGASARGSCARQRRAIADDEEFFVGRVKRNLFEQSYVGAIFTSGNPSPGSSGETYGADVRLATSRFPRAGQRNFVVDGFGVRGENRRRRNSHR